MQVPTRGGLIRCLTSYPWGQRTKQAWNNETCNLWTCPKAKNIAPGTEQRAGSSLVDGEFGTPAWEVADLSVGLGLSHFVEAKGSTQTDWTLRFAAIDLATAAFPTNALVMLLPLWCGQFLTSRRSIYPLFWGALHLAPVDVDQGRYVFITNWLQTKLGRILFLQLNYHLSHEKKKLLYFPWNPGCLIGDPCNGLWNNPYITG